MKSLQRIIASGAATLGMVVAAILAVPASTAANTHSDIIACVATGNDPFSSRDKGARGIDIEFAQELARRLERPVALNWVTIPNRGGLGKALRHSLMKDACDMFLGMPTINGQNEELAEKKLVMSVPYTKASYVLVTSPDSHIRSMSDLKKARRIGVVSATPADLYLFQQSAPRIPHGSETDLLAGLESGDIDAALIWAPALARLTMAGEQINIAMHEVVPGVELSSEFVIAMRPDDKALMQTINDTLSAMHTDGYIAKVLSRLGIGSKGMMQIDNR